VPAEQPGARRATARPVWRTSARAMGWRLRLARPIPRAHLGEDPGAALGRGFDVEDDIETQPPGRSRPSRTIPTSCCRRRPWTTRNGRRQPWSCGGESSTAA
jgi:hypothetical protein